MDNQRFQVEAAFERAWPAAEWRDVHVVLAVSGGADSVAMLRAAHSVKHRTGGRGELHVAHLNHGMRGATSDADATWVADLCRRLEIPCEVGTADVAAVATKQGDGWEAAARSARYEFLCGMAEKLGARFVAVAHTCDDQVETVLHRIFRGTGLAGLAGMPASRSLSPTVTLVRPLLNTSRAEVLEYLRAIGQDFREDVTNADRQFTRNRLRHDLLPLLRRDFGADVDQAILRLSQQAAEAQHVIAEVAEQLVADCTETSWPTDKATRANALQIRRSPLFGEPPMIVREVCKTAWTNAGWPLQPMGFDQWHQLAEMVGRRGEPISAIFPGEIRAEVRDDVLILRR